MKKQPIKTKDYTLALIVGAIAVSAALTWVVYEINIHRTIVMEVSPYEKQRFNAFEFIYPSISEYNASCYMYVVNKSFYYEGGKYVYNYTLSTSCSTDEPYTDIALQEGDRAMMFKQIGGLNEKATN